MSKLTERILFLEFVNFRIFTIHKIRILNIWHKGSLGDARTSNTRIAQRNHAITGSAVALHCCKGRARIDSKTGNSTPCKIVTPENFSSNFRTRDYVGDGNDCANFAEDRFSGGFSPSR